jgi:hypothetical protein
MFHAFSGEDRGTESADRVATEKERDTNLVKRCMTSARSIPPAAVTELQRLFGNDAVRGVIQREIKDKHYIKYGATKNDVGTSMEAELWPDQPIIKGSKVATQPSWWPVGATAPSGVNSVLWSEIEQFFSKRMIQGHLLNEKLGGTGKDMANLTPITRSANAMHNTKIETNVKDFANTGRDVLEYHVTPDYGSHPLIDELAPDCSPAAKNYIEYQYIPVLASGLKTEFTSWYQPSVGAAYKQRPESTGWEIGNEDKSVK